MRRLSLALTLACASLPIGCDSQLDSSESTSESPTTVSSASTVRDRVHTSPHDGETGVDPNAVIEIEFDRAIDPATATIEHFRLVTNDITGAEEIEVELDSTRRRVTLRPARALHGSVHRVTIAGVRMRHGGVVDHRFAFGVLHNHDVSQRVYNVDGSLDVAYATTLDRRGRRTRTVGTRADGTTDTIIDYTYHRAVDKMRDWVMWGPGDDGTLGTADDAVAILSRDHVDAEGNLTRLDYLSSGPDGRPDTRDDVILSTVRIERHASYLDDISYSDPGPDGVWLNADDTVSDYMRTTFDSAGRIARFVHSYDPGVDGRWFTADDIEAVVQETSYGPGQRVIQTGYPSFKTGWAAYYQRDVDGRDASKIEVEPGFDGIFGTADDVYGVSERYMYEHGVVALTETFFGAGPDNVPLSGDEVADERTVRSVTRRGAVRRSERYRAAEVGTPPSVLVEEITYETRR
jgi:hypothetical protein